MLLEKFVALEKRTGGKFLNAAPSVKWTGSKKYPGKRLQSFRGFRVSNNFETLRL
jgi:hypothetical protein